MFRAISVITCRKNIIYCHKFVNYNLVSIVQYPRHYAFKLPRKSFQGPHNREPCPLPPPPPPKPPKEDKLLWGTLCALILAGVGIVTAKSSPQIRDWLTIYLPFVDDLIAVLYQENMTYSEYADKLSNDVSKYFRSKPCDKDGIEGNVVPCSNEVVKEEPEEVLKCPTDICVIEQCIADSGQCILDNYTSAEKTCKAYSKLVDSTMAGDFEMKDFDKLAEAKSNRDELLQHNVAEAIEAQRKFEEYGKYMESAVTASKKEIENTKLKMCNFRDEVKIKQTEYLWAEEDAKARDALVELVEQGVRRFTDEVEALIPTYKYGGDKKFTGDADLLLFSTIRLYNRYNEELAERLALYGDRVTRAVNSVDVPEAKFKAIQTKKTGDLTKENQERYDALKKKLDDKQKNALADKQLKFENSMGEKLQRATMKAEENLNSEVEKMLKKQRIVFEVERNEMKIKLNLIEQQFNERMKAEKEIKRSQDLFAAVSSLIELTKAGPEGPICIEKYLDAIENLSTEDKLVQTIMKTIPPGVRETGIYPENRLKESYQCMEDTAMKVALIEEEGAFLPVYALSWLQNFLLGWRIPGIPQSEYEKPPKEISDTLDTFDLLQRSRFWINEGNLTQAIHYVDKMKGASRLAAQTWLVSARNTVEIRQAAEAIKAHAAAMGLRYV